MLTQMQLTRVPSMIDVRGIGVGRMRSSWIQNSSERLWCPHFQPRHPPRQLHNQFAAVLCARIDDPKF